MEMLERRGEQINVRHILIRPKTSEEDLERARVFLDSIHGLITGGKMTFAAAAEKYSDDEDSKMNGGMMFNPMTGGPVFDMDQLGSIDQRLFLTIENMSAGDISNAVKAQSPDGKESYNLYLLKSKTEPHVANMKDDYQRIQTAALAQKKNKAIEKWINQKAAETYIRIDEAFKDCPFAHRWDKN
jgi:peptidyl-prolyl cis-trans isomerase SurA